MTWYCCPECFREDCWTLNRLEDNYFRLSDDGKSWEFDHSGDPYNAIVSCSNCGHNADLNKFPELP